jgi:hypothetical protein
VPPLGGFAVHSSVRAIILKEGWPCFFVIFHDLSTVLGRFGSDCFDGVSCFLFSGELE